MVSSPIRFDHGVSGGASASGEDLSFLTPEELSIIERDIAEAARRALASEELVVLSDEIPVGAITTSPVPGDGSCGVHSMLGVKQESGWTVCNAAEERTKMAFQIIEDHQNNRLPEELKDEFRDLLTDIEHAPAELKRNNDLVALWVGLSANYLEAQEYFSAVGDAYTEEYKQQHLDSLLQPFIKSMMNTYLEHVMDPSSNLSVNELVTLAKVNNIALHVFTHDGSGVVGKAEDFNPSGEKDVYIVNHLRRQHFEPVTYEEFS